MLFSLLMAASALLCAGQGLDMSRFTQGRHVVLSYRAKMQVYGQKIGYEHYTVHNEKKQPLEFAETDSCFYLTFEISELSQSDKGVPTTLNFFLITPRRPQKGDSYTLTSIPESDDENNPIVAWDRSVGTMAAVQVFALPRCREVFAADSVPAGHGRDRIILTDRSIDAGTLTIEEIEPRSKGSEDLYIKLRFDLRATMAGGEDDLHTFPIDIRGGEAELFYVKREEMMPLIFPIDYKWADIYVPDRGRGKREVRIINTDPARR